MKEDIFHFILILLYTYSLTQVSLYGSPTHVYLLIDNLPKLTLLF
jgi:hypothetical protein